jgi:nicotinamide-nucleotide amidase
LKPGEKIAGYLLIYQEKPIFFLPGVPYQMRELMLDRVIPRLASWRGDRGRVRQKVYKVFGLEENDINERLTVLEQENRLVRIGYYPVSAEVHVSLTVRGKTSQEAEESFLQAETAIKTTLGSCIYDEDGETLEIIVGNALKERGYMLAVAESCTGGLLSHKITTVPGSSDYFSGGVVAYTNELKINFLHVKTGTLQEFGAVSRETAREMALGAQKTAGADIAVAITGIAGPDGGTKEKPVGTVCFGLAAPEQVYDFSFQFSGKRNMVQTKAANTGLDLLRRYLHRLEMPSCPGY